MLKQVFIIDKDLKMGKGKIAAQVAHGEVFYIESIPPKSAPCNDNCNICEIGDCSRGKYLAWRYDHDECMKKIVLKATSDEIDTIVKILCGKDIRVWGVIDAGFTQIDVGSRTVVVVEPLGEELCDELFGHLKLL